MSSGFKAALAYLAVLAVVEAAAIFVMENYERVRVPEWVGYSGEANRNSFLAAQRFVVAMGRDSRSIASLYAESNLPPTSGTIIVAGDRRLMSPAQSRRLLAWAEHGGDLVVTVGDDLAKDPVTNAAGVRLFEAEELGGYLPGDYIDEPETWVTFDRATDATAPADDETAADDDDDAEDTEGFLANPEAKAPDAPQAKAGDADDGERPRQLVHIPGSSELLNVSPSAHELICDDPEVWSVFGHQAAYAVRRRHGEGSITVVGSLWFIENQIIGDIDHAAFFWAILSSAGHSGPVWFVYGDDAPSIWSTIASHGWPALAALGLLVVLLLWRHMPRVGAPIAPLAPVRRELIEHVDATGRFLVDHAGAHVLVASVQRHVKKRLLMRYPQVAALPERERRGRLTQLAKLSPAEVDAIYRPQVGLSRNDFVTVQRVLERLSQNP